MVKSMTGFAQAQINSSRIKAGITIKSYNNRYIDILISMPPYLAPLEKAIRDTILRTVSHGKVEFSLRVRELASPPDVSIDRITADAVVRALKELSGSAGLDGNIQLTHILGFDGIVSMDRSIDTEILWSDIEPVLHDCVRAFDAERIREGEETRKDLEGRLSVLCESLSIVESNACELESTIRSSLERKFKEVLGNLVDENRVLAEIASYLAKHTIGEEIARLNSHISAFKTIMNEASCGKKLDFICQEMNREVNTIGSKNILVPVGKAVVAMKDAVENIREQLRNVE